MKTIYILSLIAMIALASCRDTSTNAPNTTTSSDTIAYWTFDGNSTDVSGHGHDGTLTGTFNYSFPDRFHNSDKAIEFIGGGQMNVQSMPNFSNEDSYSISFWVNLSAGGNFVSDNYGFGGDTGTFGADLMGCGLITTKPGPSADRWHLVTLAVAAHNTASLFVDNREVETKPYGSYTGTNDTMPLHIIFNQSGSTTDTVRIDDALFLSYAMSIDQVKARFQEGGWAGQQDTADSVSHVDTGAVFQWSQPTMVPNGILGMTWISGSTGFACGMQGAIWKTTDSGTTWQTINQTATQSNLYSIAFMSWAPNYGLAVGYSNGPAILYTTDGGNTWASGPVPPGVATIRDVIYGVDPGTFGFAVGSDSSGHGVILYTNYGGEYWTIDQTTPEPLNAIVFSGRDFDRYHPIIAVGDAGQVFVSTSWKSDTGNAIYTGLTWKNYSTGNENLRAISFSGSGYPPLNFEPVALTDNGSTLWSTDFGVTWAEHHQNVSTYGPNAAVSASGGSEAWISGSNIGLTRDGGVTWTNESPAIGGTWTCISARDPNHIAFLNGAELYWLTR